LCRRPWQAIMSQAKATIIELDMKHLEDVLRRAEEALGEKDYETIKAVVESYAYLAELVGDRNTTIARLRKLLFGAKTEKTAAVVDRGKDGQTPASGTDAPSTPVPEGNGRAGGEEVAEADARSDSRARNHGRNGADDFRGAEKIEVRHESLQAGDPCPQCEQGTLYETGRPGVLVRLVGQAPVKALVYYLQKLRCNLCGGLFTAKLPEGVDPEEKYDPTVGSMIALLKYGTGVPFHRAEKLQENLGIPLPASTQWDIVSSHAEHAEPVFEELMREAAQGEVVYNDDTTVRILEVMGERARQAALVEEMGNDPSEGKKGAKKSSAERKGTFTSGVVSTREGCRIALFFSGRQHAGENLADVLARRTSDLPVPIQMCDALSRNLPGELKTILANCLAHGRRQFVEVADCFPEECRHVLESLSVVYHNDALAREQNLSPEERLLFHQVKSGPIMEELHTWLGAQLDERRVEPNSGLGKAIGYLLRHWEKLTVFLRVAGAPLDNNVCERALKKAILHRKNALFYKTLHGAHVGDLFMSLIYTCELSGVNPFEYLTELERNAERVAVNPRDWMPWNYRKMLDDPCTVSQP
jgi:transposase